MRPIASTRIIDGSGVTETLSLVAMTCAITAPTWLFMSVKPHLLDAVLSDLNGLSAVLNDVISGSFSGRRSVRELVRGLQVEVGDNAGEAVLHRVHRLLEAWRPGVGLRPQRLQLAGGDEAALGPGGQPALQDLLVVVGELAVAGEQLEHDLRVAQVPLRVVVLAGAEDGRGDEVAVVRCRVLHQLASEQLADER